jgi:hypothetical protein
MSAMFDTETMAELCVKQGLMDEALAIYRRLADHSDELATRRRYEQRMAALGQPRATRPMDTPGLRVDRRGDEVEIEWRLPPNVSAPALQLLLLRRTPTGIAVEPRTTPLSSAGGTTVVVVPQLHSLRAAAGRVRDDGTFIPIVRLSAEAR